MKLESVREHNLDLTSDDIIGLLRDAGIHVGDKHHVSVETEQPNAGARKKVTLSFSWNTDEQETTQWPPVAAKP